jgi:CheY-like chemotaxis protein
MRHVLVVDDDIAVSEVIRMGLDADGTCRVTCAASAEEALALAQRDRPDAAIVDAAMPGVHGLALARTLNRKVAAVVNANPRAMSAVHAIGTSASAP